MCTPVKLLIILLCSELNDVFNIDKSVKSFIRIFGKLAFIILRRAARVLQKDILYAMSVDLDLQLLSEQKFRKIYIDVNKFVIYVDSYEAT